MILKDAIYKRTSQRNFKELPMSTKDLHTFTKGLKAIPALYPESAVTFEILSYAEAEKKFSNFGKVCCYAPYYLFFYGADTPETWHNVGYFGQVSALWLACNNYAACWQKADKLKLLQAESENAEFTLPTSEAEAEQVKETAAMENKAKLIPETPGDEVKNLEASRQLVDKNEEAESLPKTFASFQAEKLSVGETALSDGEANFLPFVLAFGSAVKNTADWQPAKKKNLKKFLISGTPEMVADLELLLDAATKAPSEYNRQPWRLWTEGKTVHVFVKPSFFFRSHIHKQADYLAIGAFVANFATLAELKQFKYQLYNEDKAFEGIKNLRYCLSLDLA